MLPSALLEGRRKSFAIWYMILRQSPKAPPLDEGERRQLIDLAWGSIIHGFAHGSPARPDPDGFNGRLKQPGAAFVTLHRLGVLRGCVGHLEAMQPLVLDVADNAFAAAFRDPRFERLEDWELEGLDLDISVLTAPRPMEFRDEPDLLAQLVPCEDGLILEEGGRRGTFLPAVWDSLREPHLFLAELKRKAGLPASYWSPTLKVSRYHTETFGR
jgi:AmmeMemoRadiSam system protein A